MAEILIERMISLDGAGQSEFLKGTLFTTEDMAHTFKIRATRGGELVVLGGTVSGAFIRPDQSTVALTGSIVDGCAVVTLTEDCYALSGRFTLTIFVTESGATTAVYCLSGNVKQTQTDSAVDPGTIIPSVADLIDQIETVTETIPPAATQLRAAMAGTYSSSATYAVGDYAWYDGVLYRCTTAITTSESWTAGHWAAAAVGDDVTELKSATKNDNITILSDAMYLRHGYINSDGIWKSVVHETMGHRIFPVDPGDSVVITANDSYNVAFCVLTSDSEPITNASAPVSADTNFNTPTDVTKGTSSNTLIMPSDAMYLYLNTMLNDRNFPASVVINGRDIVKTVFENAKDITQDAIDEADVANHALYPALSYLIATQIFPTEQNPVDYDDYKTPGSYVVGSNTYLIYIYNKPSELSTAHRLFVMSTTNAQRIIQIIIGNANTTYIWKRYYNGSTWGDWTRIFNKEDLNEILVSVIGTNCEAGYSTIPKREWAVGNLNVNTGEYTSSIQYRICTPNVQTALTKMLIRPREGYRVVVRLFTNGTQASSLSPGAEGTVIEAGQQYKLIIRKNPEDTSATVTVNDLYDKAMMFNMIQNINSIALTGDAEYVKSDYGLIPQGVFYSGITNETYNAFTFNSTASDVYDAFDALQVANDGYITRSDLGLCSDGVQHVYMYDFNPLQQEGGAILDKIPTIFLLCGQHGYEKASVFSAYYMLKHMIENPSENPVLNYLRNHCRILCIPVANPYGFNQKIYKNYNGVNLNRNWDTEGWGEGEGEQDPTSKDYAGTEPFSEPETQYARDAFIAVKSTICLAIDYHTNGSDSPVSSFRGINEILYADNMIPIWNAFKMAVRYHIKDITSHFKGQYSLAVPENEFCGGTIISAIHGGMAGRWFADQNKVSCVFETFPGFPGGQTYTPNVIEASEELISNFIITVLNYINGA